MPSNVGSQSSLPLDPYFIAAPDFNPVFDAFDDLDLLLANLSLKVAIDYPSLLSSQSSLPLSSQFKVATSQMSSQSSLPLGSQSSPRSLCDHGASLVRTDVECQDDCYILSECAHVNELLAEFVGYFFMFEAQCKYEIDVMWSYIYDDEWAWSLGFILSTVGGYEVFLSHFASSSSPRIIEFYCDCDLAV